MLTNQYAMKDKRCLLFCWENMENMSLLISWNDMKDTPCLCISGNDMKDAMWEQLARGYMTIFL